MLKNYCRSMRLVLSRYPIFFLFFIVNTIISVTLVSIPVYLTKYITQSYLNNTNINDLNKVLIIIIITFIIYIILKIVTRLLEIYKDHFKRKCLVDISIVFFNKLKTLDYENYENPAFLNDFTRSLEETNENIYNICNQSFECLKIIINSIALFTAFSSLSFMCILACAIITIIYLVIRYLTSKINFNEKTKMRMHTRFTHYNNRLFTEKESMQELKSTNMATLLLEKNDKAHDEVIKIFKKDGLLVTICSFFSGILLTALYPILIITIILTNETLDSSTLSSFTAMSVAAISISNLIRKLSTSFGSLQECLVECSLPYKILDLKSHIENENNNYKYNEIAPFQSIKFQNVSFNYQHGPLALAEINIEIKKGQKIAIVGTNGGGKTTITKLLLHLYNPIEGMIYYNGIPYTEINPDALRKKIGVVFQNVETYAFSVAENILLRKVETAHDHQILDEAISFAELEELISKLDNGVNTIVSREFDHQGKVLSGGMRQRLAIARGYAKESDLLILDEPTSALDPLAEAKLYENIYKLKTDKTLVFISHRLTTTVNADKIYLFDHGRIIEQGNHEELMKLNGVYKKMFDSQSKKYLGGEYNE